METERAEYDSEGSEFDKLPAPDPGDDREWMPRVSRERRRGCGFRKVGGLYVVAGDAVVACGRLPLPLMTCPTCHGGIKPARGWTWINANKLAADCSPCPGPTLPGTKGQPMPCPKGACPMSGANSEFDKVGLLWVGEAYYPTPEDFLAEVRRQGISRRLPQLPRDLEPGKTWCFLAHRKGYPNPMDPEQPMPGIFAAFKVRAVEGIVKPDVSKEECEALRKRGIEPVCVEIIEEDSDERFAV